MTGADTAMNQGTYELLKRAFQGALALPAEERRDYLVRQCAGDVALCKEAEALLRHYDLAGGFLETPPRVEAHLEDQGPRAP